MSKRVAMYLRVSTDSQTTENQCVLLEEVAARNGWEITHVFEDAGISGAKGRDKRPAFDELLKGVARRDFNMIMAFSVCRLGRSLTDLIGFLNDIQAKDVDLYLHQQGISTDQPSSRLLFSLLGVFSEFERAILRSRVKASLYRLKQAGVQLGRPALAPIQVKQIQQSLTKGLSIRAIAKKHGTSPATVMRVKQETHVSMAGSAPP